MFIAIVEPVKSVRVGVTSEVFSCARTPSVIAADGTTLVVADDTLAWFDKWYMFIPRTDGFLHQAAIS